MAANSTQSASLAAILQTLAACSSNPYPNLTPQLQQPIPLPYAAPSAPQLGLEDELEEGEYEPEEYEPEEYDPGGYEPYEPSNAVQLPAAAHTLPLHSQPRQIPTPQPSSRPPSVPPKVAPVDPTTITTWPPALRHVTKLVSQNEAVLNGIRKLIATQHQHEKQWWDGRNALLQKQKDRVEGRKKLDEVLKAVGGKVDANVGNLTAEDEAKEVLLYDKKVHRACSEMHKAALAELKGLGIPFFGTSESCLTKGDQSETSPPAKGKEGEKSVRKLGESDLRELQKRMLVLLEDLCQE